MVPMLLGVDTPPPTFYEVPQSKVTIDPENAVKSFEGFRTKAYRGVDGKKTIGYGHVTRKVNVVTPDEAEALLKADLDETTKAVVALVPKYTPSQLTAMVSLCYNIGVAAFTRSDVLKLHNAGNYEGAAKAFLHWNMVHGKIVKGLTNRRREEMKLYMED